MIIELKNVSKKFKDITVINDVNIKLKANNIYGLYGRNGSGKSVLLKLISGFYVPTNGTILYDGVDLNKKMEFPKDLRALIEKPSFFPDLSGFDNLKLLAQIQNKITDKEINEALKIVNLFDEKDKIYKKYSLGMKQKLGIASVIMEDPKVMVLDEPFNGIETSTVNKLINYLLSHKKDKIIIISTHIKDDLEKLSDRIYYIDNGVISDKEFK